MISKLKALIKYIKYRFKLRKTIKRTNNIKLRKIVEEVDALTDGLGLPIDPGIEKAVIALRYYGFPTVMSCEGHASECWGYPYPWVHIDAGDEEINETYRQVMRSLLDAFYTTREKDLRALTISPRKLGAFRLQTLRDNPYWPPGMGSKDYNKTMPRDPIILAALQKEMDDFADFLLMSDQEAK